MTLYNVHDLYLYDDPLDYQSRYYVPHHIETVAAVESGDRNWRATSGVDTWSTHEVQQADGTTYQAASVSAISTRLWNRQTLTEAARVPGVFYSLALSPHGDILVGISTSAIEAWNTKTQQQLWTLPAHFIPPCALEYYAVYSCSWVNAAPPPFTPSRPFF